MDHGTFISKLGEAEAVAADLAKLSGESVTAHAMSNWNLRGIPKYLRPFAAQLAEQKGVPLPKDLRRYVASTSIRKSPPEQA